MACSGWFFLTLQVMDIRPAGGAREEHRRGLALSKGTCIHVGWYCCGARFGFGPVAAACAEISCSVGLASDLP